MYATLKLNDTKIEKKIIHNKSRSRATEITIEEIERKHKDEIIGLQEKIINVYHSSYTSRNLLKSSPL